MKRQYSRWTVLERTQLLALIEQQQSLNCQQISWTIIADALQTKKPRQCYDQYLLIKKKQLSAEESLCAEKPVSRRKSDDSAIRLLGQLLN